MRAYVISALVALGLFGMAQYRGWSFMPSDAEEFQRSRAEQAVARTSSGGFRTGGSSGHK
jgi:hypothetical protein